MPHFRELLTPFFDQIRISLIQSYKMVFIKLISHISFGKILGFKTYS